MVKVTTVVGAPDGGQRTSVVEHADGDAVQLHDGTDGWALVVLGGGQPVGTHSPGHWSHSEVVR